MKKNIYICLILSFIFIFTLFFINTKEARAQLLVIGNKYRVTKVDVPKRRFEARLNSKKAGVYYILIRKNTIVLQDGQAVPWTKIKPGDIVTIDGGLTWDLKIKAKKIILP